jgi:hypothetical protein
VIYVSGRLNGGSLFRFRENAMLYRFFALSALLTSTLLFESCRSVKPGAGGGSDLAWGDNPLSVKIFEYMRAAAKELHSDDRNYCYADDLCFHRASAMLAKIVEHSRNNPDLRGSDREWCNVAQLPKLSRDMGMSSDCDDLAAKVVILYPPKGKWGYHIATAVKTNKGWMTIDPIGSNLKPMTPYEWCEAWAHSRWDVGNAAGPRSMDSAICQLVPGNQNDYSDFRFFDIYEASHLGVVQKHLAEHACSLRKSGRTPSRASGPDRDFDGIPDQEDLCPDTPAGQVDTVEYCNSAKYGCGAGETPI